jgi:ABC-type transport system involved in Fe-S cluster assembly fused permease/ATPase subunit
MDKRMKRKITEMDRINMQAYFVLPLVFLLGPMFLINIYAEIHNQKIDKELLFEQEKKEAEIQAEQDKEEAKSQI